MSTDLPAPALIEPPGALRRAAAGAWHVPAGFGYLIRNPSLWSLAVGPALVTLVAILLGLVAGAFLAPAVENKLTPPLAHLPPALGLALTLILWGGTMAAGMAVGLALALLVTAPLLERLSRKVEAQMGGRGAGRVPVEHWDVAAPLRSGLVFLIATIAGVMLGMLPLIGPFLGAALCAPLLAYQATDPTLSRRGLDAAGKKAWHRRWRGETIGFGLAALVALLVPVVSALLPPALAVGGARLVLDLEGIDLELGDPELDPEPES